MKTFTDICKTCLRCGLWLSVWFSVTADITLATSSDDGSFATANLRIGDTPLLNRKVVNASYVSVLEHPYVVSVRRNCSHYLTGALLTTGVVVTAAHPLHHVPTYELGVVGGESYCDRGASVLAVVAVVIHPLFDVSAVRHDLALVRVYEEQSSRLGMKPVPLIAANASIAGLSAFVTGWGQCSAATRQICLPRHSRYYPGESVDPTLRSVFLHVDKETCDEYTELGLPISAGMLCVGEARRLAASAPCLGVPGAPLVVGGQLLGLLSWGYGCGYTGDLPLVYTDVRKYHRWLTYNLEILESTTHVQLSELYQATRAYVLRDALVRTRRNPPPANNTHQRALTAKAIDNQLTKLSGRVFDVRDFVEDMKYHENKKKMYRDRRQKMISDGLLLVNEEDYFEDEDSLAESEGVMTEVENGIGYE
ncbi:trypsin delta isoform X2 [Plutella xylostella]|uniref:trypsin delta isoform X2 n=1 Tax=Plutella xylostella TaxID=51655 RepID=UPI0020330D16|nr:trypsin delta isoform X2 [Plutella xylostella]